MMHSCCVTLLVVVGLVYALVSVLMALPYSVILGEHVGRSVCKCYVIDLRVIHFRRRLHDPSVHVRLAGVIC